jgi:hypothetical protein
MLFQDQDSCSQRILSLGGTCWDCAHAFGAMRSLVRQRTNSPWRTWGTAPGDCIAPKARSHYQPGATAPGLDRPT